ncbi:MAG: hypothetical protein PHU25_19640 [Deltaproteobacteria bacterium]|nr:hypothetical protein [Deltaproteobacteria bacterium]
MTLKRGMTSLLIIAVAALAAGPVLAQILGANRRAAAVIDGFVLFTVGGIALFDVLPEALAGGGLPAVLAAIAGVATPALLARFVRHERAVTFRGALILALVGLAAHAFLDGTALAGGGHGHEDHARMLALAVVFHRFPEGLAIWWLVRPSFGVRAACLVILAQALSTLGGYFGGGALMLGASEQAVSTFQALMAGLLLHVLTHHHTADGYGHAEGHGHHGEESHARGREPAFSASGAMAGVVLLAFLFSIHFAHAEGGNGVSASEAFLSIGAACAPFALAGIVAAGLLGALRPRTWSRIERAGLPGCLASLLAALGIAAAGACMLWPAAVVLAAALACVVAHVSRRAARSPHPGLMAAAHEADLALPWLSVGIAVAAFAMALADPFWLAGLPFPPALAPPGPIGLSCLAVLAGLMVWSLFRRGPREVLETIMGPGACGKCE